MPFEGAERRSAPAEAPAQTPLGALQRRRLRAPAPAPQQHDDTRMRQDVIGAGAGTKNPAGAFLAPAPAPWHMLDDVAIGAGAGAYLAPFQRLRLRKDTWCCRRRCRRWRRQRRRHLQRLGA